MKVQIDYARQEDGLIYGPYMCVLEEYAEVAYWAPAFLLPSRDPVELMSDLTLTGYVPVEPAYIALAANEKRRDIVAFRRVCGRTRDDLQDVNALNLSWWCQIYAAGLDVAMSVLEPDVFLMLDGKNVVGAVKGTSPYNLHGNYRVVWRASDV